MGIGYIITIRHEDGRKMFRNTWYGHGDAMDDWNDKPFDLIVHATKDEALEKVNELLECFDGGNCGAEKYHYPWRAYVGATRVERTATESSGQIIDALVAWTPLGEVIEAKFTLVVDEIVTHPVKVIVPKINVTYVPSPPKPKKPPVRTSESRAVMAGDVRMVEVTYILEEDGNRTAASFRFPLEHKGKDATYKVEGKTFEESDLTPSQFTGALNFQRVLYM